MYSKRGLSCLSTKASISRPKRTRISKSRQSSEELFDADNQDLPVLQGGRLRPSGCSTNKNQINNADECEVKNEPIDDDFLCDESEDTMDTDYKCAPNVKNELVDTFSVEEFPDMEQSSSAQPKDPVDSQQHEGNVNVKINTDKMKYRCTVCRKTYSYLANYNVHLRMHTGDRPHKCPHCPKTFPYEINLTQHLQTHFGERPYSCPYCSKSYARNGPYISHIRKHKKDVQ